MSCNREQTFCTKDKVGKNCDSVARLEPSLKSDILDHYLLISVARESLDSRFNGVLLRKREASKLQKQMNKSDEQSNKNYSRTAQPNNNNNNNS